MQKKKSIREKLVNKNRNIEQLNHAIPENTNNSPSTPSSSTSTPLANNPYQTRQSIGKALSRTRISNQVGLTIENQRTQNVRKSPLLTDETRIVASNFYFRPDIAYTMLGIYDTIIEPIQAKSSLGNIISLCFYERLTIFIVNYMTGTLIKLCHTFCTFWDIHLRSVLLFNDSPKDQCTCQMQENLFLKSEAMGIPYDSSFWEKVLCSTQPKSECWLVKCHECQDGRWFVSLKPLNSVTTLRQREKVVINKNNRSNESNETARQEMNSKPKKKVFTRWRCNSHQLFIGEVLVFL